MIIAEWLRSIKILAGLDTLFWRSCRSKISATMHSLLYYNWWMILLAILSVKVVPLYTICLSALIVYTIYYALIKTHNISLATIFWCAFIMSAVALGILTLAIGIYFGWLWVVGKASGIVLHKKMVWQEFGLIYYPQLLGPFFFSFGLFNFINMRVCTLVLLSNNPTSFCSLLAKLPQALKKGSLLSLQLLPILSLLFFIEGGILASGLFASVIYLGWSIVQQIFLVALVEYKMKQYKE